MNNNIYDAASKFVKDAKEYYYDTKDCAGVIAKLENFMVTADHEYCRMMNEYLSRKEFYVRYDLKQMHDVSMAHLKAFHTAMMAAMYGLTLREESLAALRYSAACN